MLVALRSGPEVAGSVMESSFRGEVTAPEAEAEKKTERAQKQEGAALAARAGVCA
jgi:hypothetical protein